MRAIAIALIVGAGIVVALGGCAETMPDYEPPRIVPPPVELSIDCASPIGVPARELSQQEVERYWGADRRRLVECRDRHTGLAIYIRDRDAAIMGAP